MLRHGAGSGILMGAVLCAIGGGLSLLGSRLHGPGGPQAIYIGVAGIGALRILVALIPERRSRGRQAGYPPVTPAHVTGAPHMTGAPYVTGGPQASGASYVAGRLQPTGAPAPAPLAQVSFSPTRTDPGRCWDCGSRVRPNSAVCFHCGAAQVNGYQRATGRPARATTSGPAPMDAQGPAEYPRYEPARPS